MEGMYHMPQDVFSGHMRAARSTMQPIVINCNFNVDADLLLRIADRLGQSLGVLQWWQCNHPP